MMKLDGEGVRTTMVTVSEVPIIRQISPYTYDSTSVAQVYVGTGGTVQLVGQLERPPHPLESILSDVPGIPAETTDY